MRREALLVAGDLYEQSGNEDESLRVYLGYIDEFSVPLETAVEIRFKVANVHERRGAREDYLDQLAALVEIDRKAGEARTDRTRYLAAQSALVLTSPVYEKFAELELTQPFADTLKQKKALMSEAISGFESLVSYEVSEVTAAATYYLAEIYGEFSQALIDSERPGGLSASELASYEMVLEEEAYPFEEQSISVHQENVELLRAGLFNDWVQRSLDELAVLMPARYAKHERSSGFVGNIDQYAYQAPLTEEPEPDTAFQELGMTETGMSIPPDEPNLTPAEIAGANDA